MRKFFFVIIPSILIALLIFLVIQYLVEFHSQKGALQVTSSPESKVYLNNRFIGQTPLCKCEANDMPATGEYNIRLVPLDKSYYEFQEKILISEAVLTVVDRKFGKGSKSEGSVISLAPLIDNKKSSLLVVSFPQDALVLLDDKEIGRSPIAFQNPTESDHVLLLKKIGYRDKTIRIRTPLGYKLTVAAYLSTNIIEDTSSSSAIPAIFVTIQTTPTGFLRVRQDALSTSKEIGTVFSGEIYPLLKESNGWYEIRLKNGLVGWVSSQYSKKQ